MEFHESLMRFMIHKPDKKVCGKNTDVPNGNGKHKWKISFHKTCSSPSNSPVELRNKEPPKEFTCSISGILMADPVIVSSGHTFERNFVVACKKLSLIPTLPDGSTPDFSTVISNLALKSTISNFCHNNGVDFPQPLDFNSAEKLVRTLSASQSNKSAVVSEERELINGISENPSVKAVNHAASDVARRSTHFYTSSDESVGTTADLNRPLPLTTQPSCYTATEASAMEPQNPNSSAEDEEADFVTKLKSSQVHEIETVLISLRNITRTMEESRVPLCTSRLLSALRPLIISRYTNIQVNSVAALLNLSLDNANKVKILRSGIVPPLINVLKGGFAEAQEHASGALFSLALDDDNKAAIGVLGGIQPLLHMLRSDSERTRFDSALALYHLTLVQSNRAKLIKLGSVNNLLAMAKSGHLPGPIMLILCNLAACPVGRITMLDSGAVECLVEMLKTNDLYSPSTKESCVVALYGLSHGGLRFKGLAKDVGAVEVLRKVEVTGKERAREKAKRIIEMMKVREEEEEEEIDWEKLIDSGFAIRNHGRGGLDGPGVNSSEFC